MTRILTLCGIGALALACVLALTPRPGRSAFDRREDARLHAHFAAVLRELAARDVSCLDQAQRASRSRLLVLLRDYDRQGRFPRNEGQRPGFTPIFVDRHGTRCAMADLIERSGGGALVARIAATANLARIRQLADDQALVRWLASSGLDLAEAARIQPEYGPPPIDILPPPGKPELPSDAFMATTTLLSVFLGVPAIALNLAPRPTPVGREQAGVFAVLVGAGSLGVGLVDGVSDGHLRGGGYAQLAIGASALTLGYLHLHQRPAVASAARAAPASGSRAALAVRPGQTGEPQIGFQVSF